MYKKFRDDLKQGGHIVFTYYIIHIDIINLIVTIISSQNILHL